MGSVVFGSAMSGYMLRKLYWTERGILCIGAICMISPDIKYTFIGILIVGVIVISQLFIFKKGPKLGKTDLMVQRSEEYAKYRSGKA